MRRTMSVSAPRVFIPALLLCFLASCTGPIYVAKTQDEAMRKSYDDPGLSRLAATYEPALKSIYDRYQLAGIDAYPQGLGFTIVSDEEGKKHYYLLVEVRSRDIMFGEVQTKPQERFSEVFDHHLEHDLRYVRAQDVDGMKGVDGLAFGVFWPVRDLSQCDKYGGFIEYMIVYLPKTDLDDLLAGSISLAEAVRSAEVVTSLNRKPAESVRVVVEK